MARRKGRWKHRRRVALRIRNMRTGSMRWELRPRVMLWNDINGLKQLRYRCRQTPSPVGGGPGPKRIYTSQEPSALHVPAKLKLPGKTYSSSHRFVTRYFKATINTGPTKSTFSARRQQRGLRWRRASAKRL